MNVQIIKNLVAASLAAGLALAPVAGIAQEAQPQQAEQAPVTVPDAEAAPVAPAPVAEAPSAQPLAAPAPAATAQADEADVTVFDQVVERDATLPHNLSPWGMFMAADWVVKAVMIGLAFASLVTWTVWLAKSLELAAARRRLGAHLDRIIGSKTLDEAAGALENRSGPAPLLVRAARHEMQMSSDMLPYGGSAGLKERVASHLSRIEAQASRRMTRGTGVLATIGSTAPFVGLFGTVWGIMNSFIGISESQTTNLAIVAPGIAEALLATAIGLVAAIPAVVIYNVFARSIAGYKLLLGDASAAVERLVSRDIDRRALPQAVRAVRAAE
ncbi:MULTISPECIES: tonB-system energizer ExbB [unclassified Aminobacter]|uniref:tonB-system energizer ExbB n=1 Tax=unclassified Aminobacter TaxID=2644704 RepID=UPI0011A0A83C|nr:MULTISPECIES: tonB-system energizer ExbB [unclassified Aminobacter]